MNETIFTNPRDVTKPGRPSLYANEPDRAASTASIGILKGIEPKPRLRLSMAWGAPLMAISAILSVGMLNFGFERMESFETPLLLAKIQDARTQAVPESMATMATSEPIPESNVVPAVAAIINDEIGPEAQPAVVLAAGSGFLKDSQAEATIAASPVADAAGASTLIESRTDPAVEAVAPIRRNTGQPHGPANLTRTATVPGKDRSAPTGSLVRTSKTNAGKDKDVDLIAALLSHVANGAKAPAAEPSKHAVVPSQPARTSPPVAKRDQKTTVNRDVVTAAPGESIESLVKRCRALGFVEGELCRLRVCSGLWGKDTACPSTSVGQSD